MRDEFYALRADGDALAAAGPFRKADDPRRGTADGGSTLEGALVDGLDVFGDGPCRFASESFATEAPESMTSFLGIDVGKADFHVALLIDDKSLFKSFPNVRMGLTQLAS